MNIKDLLSNEKAVSMGRLFESEKGIVHVVQILQDEQLKEHTSKVPALLLCVIGEVVFENELNVKETMLSGDFVKITPLVKHLIRAKKDSQLILFK